PTRMYLGTRTPMAHTGRRVRRPTGAVSARVLKAQADGQGGVDLAGVVGGDEQGLAQAGIAGLGRSAVAVGLAGGVGGRDQPGEGADRGQVGESCWVAESSEDLGCADAAGAGYRAHDPGWVGLVVERADALVEPVDLVGQGQREPGFGGDIGASASKSSWPPSAPHSRSVVAAASMTASARSSAHAWRLERRKNAARRALPRRLTQTGLAYRAKNRSAVNVISEPSAAIHAGPRISSSASRRAMHAVRRCTSPERILTARFSSSPGPSESSRCSPSGCKRGSRASTLESSRSVLVCLL